MQQSTKAFTLIELLVVIAIIAILAAILFPVFAQAKLAAKKAADLSNIKQIGTAVAIYLNDSDDTYFFADTYPANGTYGDMYRWSSANVIGPYTKNTQILLSPLDSPYTPDFSGGWSYMTPTAPRVAYPLSYMANALSTDLVGANSPYFPANVTDYRGPIAPGTYSDRGASGDTPNTAAVSSTEASNPSNLIVFTGGAIDAENDAYCGSTHNNTETYDGCFGDGDLFWGWDAANYASGTYFGGADPIAFKVWRKASNQSNFSFADTHAKSLAPGALLLGPFQLNPRYFLVNSAGY
jgi:prepilin-type N-terminal cleavage/methylation domain-containing protein